MTYTDNINFREKYLKYKRKYIDLKNFQNIQDLHGGYYLPNIDRTSQTFVDINNQNETELLLSNKFIGNSRNLERCAF
jgi:hypothetical protein